MDYSNPVSILVAAIFVTIFSLKVKDDCYYCFLALFSIGVFFFIFGLVKYWRRRNG